MKIVLWCFLKKGIIVSQYFDGEIDFIEEDEPQPIGDVMEIDMAKYEGMSVEKVKLI